jgi:hypothetical protein
MPRAGRKKAQLLNITLENELPQAGRRGRGIDRHNYFKTSTGRLRGVTPTTLHRDNCMAEWPGHLGAKAVS